MDIGHWTTFLHSESFIVRSSLWLLHWYRSFGILGQKWLQGIQRPCGSFRKFSIKLLLKPPTQKPMPRKRLHACMHKACDGTKSVTSLSYISSLNDKWVACLPRTAPILQVLKIAFVVDFRTLVPNLRTCTQRMFGRKNIATKKTQDHGLI